MEDFTLNGLDLFGNPIEPEPYCKLADDFIIPPFSVLNAREGEWQERKRKWISLGIKSELGRGDQLIPNGGGVDEQGSLREGGGATSWDSPRQQPSIAVSIANGLTWGNSDAMRHPSLNYYRDQKRNAGSE